MSGEENIGYYSYAHKVLQIAIGFCTAVTSAFQPRLSYYFEYDKKRFDELLKKGQKIVSFLAFPAAVGLFLLAPEAIEILFGAAFLPVAQTLRCFSGMVLFTAFGNLLCYQIMICSGNENKLVPVLSAATCLNVILNYLLIPRLQENGAAIASVCTELFIDGVEIIYITWKLKIKYEWKAIGLGVFSSAVMGVCIISFKQVADISLFSFACCICGGVIIYVCTNIILKNQFALEIMSTIKQRVRFVTQDNGND